MSSTTVSSKLVKGFAKILARKEWTPQELAAAVAKVIRKREDLWNQRTWFGHRTTSVAGMRDALADSEPACGTTGCVAGWVAALSLPGDTSISSSGSFWNSGTGLNGNAMDFAKDKLALDHGQASWLFSGDRTLGQVLFALDLIAAGRSWDVTSPSSHPRTVTVTLDGPQD